MADNQKSNSGRFRGWAWRLSNYGEQEEKDLIAKLTQKDYDYTIYSREIGADTKTPHLQGFSYFRNPRTLNGLKNIITEFTGKILKVLHSKILNTAVN